MGWFRELFTIYATTKVVQIRSKSLAITYFTLVALVWLAVLKSYQLDLRKIYQQRCPVRGTFTTKVKGILSTEKYTDEELNITSPEQYRRLWDTQDIIVYGEEGFMVMTNIIITANQQRGMCPSNTFTCTTDDDCIKGTPDKSFDGILTGYCYTSEGKCKVSAWCPTEEDILPLNGSIPLFHDTMNFTALLKTSVEFPSCESMILPGVIHRQKYRRRNILTNFTLDYLKNCRYHPVHHPFCPIFILGDIVKWSGQVYNNVAITGGIFSIVVVWDCDFDWGLTIYDCLPTYKFLRVDALETNEENLAPGFNWRSAVYFEGNRRTLTKFYGIKFLVKIYGEGRKFDFLNLVLTIGASIGLFSLAPLFCDFLFDLFCYLKSFKTCNPCFSSSFKKEIRYQNFLPATPKHKTLEQNLCLEVSEIENSVSLTCDTRL